jgi:putative ABC transport system permease protein
MLSVLLGVGSAVAVLIVKEGSNTLLGQTDYGYDLIVGKGSPVQLVLNTVYHIDNSPGNIPYSLYETLASPRHPQAKIAVPIVVGDTYHGRRIVATTPKMFGYDDEGKRIPDAEDTRAFHYRPGKRMDVGQGRMFHPRKFEAVIGSDITKLTGLKLGDKFRPTHGAPAAGQTSHEHDEQWEVVGVLGPTHTSNDRVLFIPLVTTYCIEEHEEGMAIQSGIRAAASGAPTTHPATGSPAAPPRVAPKAEKGAAAAESTGDLLSNDAPSTASPAEPAKHDAHEGHEEHEEHYTLNPDGTVEPKLPKDEWLLSAILVKTREIEVNGRRMTNPTPLKYNIDATGIATAVMPAQVMSEFFSQILAVPSLIILLVCGLVTVVAAVGILVSIYNSVAARKREIAILRALGATKTKVLTLICVEAGLIGLAGGLLGVLVGHLIGAVGSRYMDELLGQGFNWMLISWEEVAYLAGVVLIAVLAGLVPAMKAYRTPVATNLVAA